MANRIRIDFTHDELVAVIRGLDASSKRGLKNTKDLLIKRFMAKPLAGVGVMAMIIRAISILTGVPENQIKPSSKLVSLGLTPSKMEQLRVHCNKFIKEQGGTSFISAAEMGALTTVQDLNDLVESKIP